MRMDDAAGTSAVPPSEVEAQTPPPEQNVVISGKIVWQAIGAVLATLFLLWAINQARGVVSMVAIAFFFSLALDPAVRWITGRYGWRRGSAVGVIYLAGALFVGFMVIILIPAISELAKRSEPGSSQNI